MKRIFLFLMFVITANFCFSQLKVSILGDSYSTYKGWVPSPNISWYSDEGKPGRDTDVFDVQKTWWHMIISHMGAVLEKNNSYSGATVCCTGYEGNDYSDRAFVTRLTDLGHPDVIFVMGGTNDDWAEVPMGDYIYDNQTKQQLYNFRPAFAYMMGHLRKLYPSARIINVVNDALTHDMKESQAVICRHYKVENVQLEGISKKTLHPSLKGMEQIVGQIEKIL